MERLRKYFYDSVQDENFNPDAKYEMAYKQVKRIKGFYIHVVVYVILNLFSIGYAYYKENLGLEAFLKWDVLATPFFWGIGLLAHGLSVFGRNLLFNSDWEEKKIKELMDKDKNQKWE